MRLVEDLGIRLLAREPHQVIVGHAAETAVPDWIETWSSTWPTTRTRLRVFSPEPPRACADARHYAADAAFGEKRDAGARTSHQCRTLFVVVGLQQLFESEGMSAIEIERPAAERQGEGRRAAGSLDKSAKRLHPGSRFLGSATSIRSVPRLGPPLRSRRYNHQLVRRPSPLMGQSMRSVLQGGRTADSSSGRREH